MVNDKLIVKEEKEYYLLNKPRGVITSTSDDKGRTTVIDLIDTEARIYPVGRLDYDTTGALLLTNDGEFANILTHPKNNIDKVYLAKLNGIIKGEQINKLKDGVMLDNVLVKPSRVKLKKVDPTKNTSMVEITVHEGKNHEVKRLFESVGFLVDKLTRERIGIFNLEGLKSGEYRLIKFYFSSFTSSIAAVGQLSIASLQASTLSSGTTSTLTSDNPESPISNTPSQIAAHAPHPIQES